MSDRMRGDVSFYIIANQHTAVVLDRLRTFVRDWGFRAGEDDALMDAEFQPTGIMEAMHILDACGRDYRG